MKNYSFTINGEAISTENVFDVKNPATGTLLGYASNATKDHVEAAIDAAKVAQPAWAAKSDTERKNVLMQVAQVLTDNTDYLAKWITQEQGKPLAGPGSMFEMEACVGWTQVPASLDLPVEVVFEDDSRRDEMHRKPVGVVGAITPWNWPLMIAIWQIIPALRAGNTVVLKPSEYTTIGTLEMIRLMNTVLPAGVLNTISGGGEVGAMLVEHKDVDKIMFTGSASTARKIIEASSGNMARLTLECGGNDAAIILPGTDIQSKVGDLFWGAFINMGQTCACAKRLYVHEDDYDNVVEALDAVAAQMPMGNGMDEGILLGPIQNKMQYDKVNDLVEDAKANGASVIRGGKSMGGPGYFYPITLLGNVDNGIRIVDEEQFGPVLPIIKYKTVDEAIQKANDTKTGLGGSVWGDDLSLAAKIASRIEAGTVWINQHGAIHPMVPFGGVKDSGYGVEFGVEGLKAVTQPQIISIKKTTLAEA
ncbi:aldehyde dehydrogenase family protein [Marixanthomonas ophiurae]|uniref:Aldehyde dehydrogenase family protein n=1 Tax=Marixanthomonas ophiurae TaxID=387659 RepID=A0A3E1Q6P8_9FLAO|nr:aldehyde dehydrogenase family protein [Marixanthomonas ophiurae]RFN57800.1 aldehyde dehydrogenase family protein [Marixanthomonas ophiurae]